MAYTSLYRRYRPDTFRDVIGQNHVVKTLVNQIKSGNIGHAYLFTGTRGTGKTSVAKIFLVRSTVCTRRTALPAASAKCVWNLRCQATSTFWR